MKTLSTLIYRNTKLFFKDKAMVFTALITPMILLVLYATFLGNVYKDAFLATFIDGRPEALTDKLVNGFVGGQLISSILAVSCVTVAFCANLLAVQDKANGTLRDLTVSPIGAGTLAVAYYVSTFLTTVLICLAATALSLIYIAFVGWYMSFLDVLLLILDVILVSLFGTALSSVVNFFLSTQGQMSAVGSIVSSCYGFVCGAYMPISQFAEVLQKILMFLPSTYGTALFRVHALQGIFRAMENAGIQVGYIDVIKQSIDAELSFFGHTVPTYAMYLVVGLTTAALLGAYIIMHKIKHKDRKVK